MKTFALIYLLIVILWGAYAVYMEKSLSHYPRRNFIGYFFTFFVNLVAFPFALVIAIKDKTLTLAQWKKYHPVKWNKYHSTNDCSF